MNRRKLALLIALSVLLIVLAAVTATTAWEVLGAGYEVAGDHRAGWDYIRRYWGLSCRG